MDRSSEKALMHSISCGDVSAMKQIKARYEDLVCRIALRILCDRKDTEAVTQEVFLHVWNDAAEFDESLSLQAWILRYTCRYARLRIVRRRIMYIFGERPDLFVTTAPKTPTYDDFVTKQAWELYCRISDRLSITNRIIFALCVLEEISEKDASAIMGISLRRMPDLISSVESKFRKELRRLESTDDYYRYIGFLRKVAEGLS